MSWKMAVQETVEYARRFGCELSASEVRERLIGSRVVRGKLPGFKRNNDSPYVGEKMRLAREITEKWLAKIPEIVMVGVTGSVAAGYPKADDDIDLMVVTRSESLWLVRAWVTWMLWRQGIPRRRPGRVEGKNELCLNLWLEEDSLLVPREKQNLQNAVDLILMRPILVRNRCADRFLRVNHWVKKYVATGYEYKVRMSQAGNQDGGTAGNLPATGVRRWLNWIAYLGQRWYMATKITDELVNLKAAFFHPVKKSV